MFNKSMNFVRRLNRENLYFSKKSFQNTETCVVNTNEVPTEGYDSCLRSNFKTPRVKLTTFSTYIFPQIFNAKLLVLTIKCHHLHI